MAPVLSGVSRWGPEASMLGSGAAAWLDGGGGDLGLVGVLATLTALALLSLLLLLLCASCQGQKKTANGHAGVDNENLINGVSERETFSQSVDSPATDQAISTSHNGPLTSGTVLTDTSPQPSEELQSSQTDLRSSKCPQGRELPSIPPSTALIEAPASGDGTYEVVKQMVAASRDLSAEDSLYETVKELKNPPPASSSSSSSSGGRQFSLNNGTGHVAPHCPPPPVPNGRPSPGPSPCTPERGPLCAGVEYASVNFKKKSRHSTNMEAKRSSGHGGGGGGGGDSGGGGGGDSGGAGGGSGTREPEGAKEPEEEVPPPLPEKVLDINDNQPLVLNGPPGVGLNNGESHSSLSPSPSLESHIMAGNESAVYFMADKSNCVAGMETEEEKEHDYTSIAEMNGMVPASSSSDLYATVRDIYPQPDSPKDEAEGGPTAEATEPCYETIRIPKVVPDAEEGGAGLVAVVAIEGSDGVMAEPDYECLGELSPSRETSRL